jgi:hypothetical protein
MSKELIAEKKELLNSLITKNKNSKVFDEIDELNRLLKSSLLENEVLKLRSRQSDFEMNVNDPAFSGERMTQERASIRNAIIALKDKTLQIMEFGEAKIDSIPDTPTASTASKINIVDIAIVILTSLVFIVLLVAFAFALLGNPINIGLIAFASALMILIILGLIKYKRDLGKGVYQIR